MKRRGWQGRSLCVCVLLLVGGIEASPADGRSELVRSGFAVPNWTLRLGSGPHQGAVARSVVGPVFAGHSVVWAEQGAPGVWRVSRAPLTGASRASDSVRYAPRPHGITSLLKLEGSSSVVGIGTGVPYCPSPKCDHVARDRLAIWRPGGHVRQLLNCGSSACPSRCRPPGLRLQDFALADTTIAWADNCAQGLVHVRELEADPFEHRYVVSAPFAQQLHGDGRFLAWITYSSSTAFTLVVYDRLTRTVSYKLPAWSLGWAIAGNGDAGLFAPRGYSAGIAWASPDSPNPHFVRCGQGRCPAGMNSEGVIGLGRGLIAIAAIHPTGERIAVVRFDGSPVASKFVHKLYGTDSAFDGRYVAFATQPCQTTAIVVWDIRDPTPPRLSNAPCPPARADDATLNRRALRLRVSCPAHPALGCVGVLQATAFQGGGFVALPLQTYLVPFGRSRTLSIPIGARARRFLKRHRRARLYVESRAKVRTEELPTGTPERADAFLSLRRTH